jgi:hypothetical protein
MGGSLKREMGQLLQIYPAWQSLAIERHGSVVDFTTPPTGCHFLQDDNRCGIETAHGRALKPGVCLLFPFNRLGRIGRTVTIQPHYLCPLRLVLPARPGEVEGTHEKVLAMLQETQLVDETFEDRVTAFPLRAGDKPRDVLARERRFCAECTGAIGRRTFRQTLADWTNDAGELDRFVERGLALYGLKKSPRGDAPDTVDHLFHAMAPSLRLDLLTLGEPAIAKALALGEEMARDAWRLSSTSPSARTVFRAYDTVVYALRLLASDPEPLRLPSLKRMKIPVFGDAAMTFAMFGAHRRAEQGTPVLEALEASFKPELSVADRSVLLIELGSRAALAARRRTR